MRRELAEQTARSPKPAEFGVSTVPVEMGMMLLFAVFGTIKEIAS